MGGEEIGCKESKVDADGEEIGLMWGKVDAS
jgi:hypothetical protein